MNIAIMTIAERDQGDFPFSSINGFMQEDKEGFR